MPLPAAEWETEVSPELEVRFTEFEHAETVEGHDVRTTWNDFAQAITSSGFVRGKNKNKVALLVPASFSQGSVRKTLDNIEQVYMGALDFDNRTEEEFEEVIQRITDEGLDAVVYSTWGHPAADPLYKFRVLVPFSRPIDKAEWSIFWPVLSGLLGSLADSSCKDPSRGYFVPAAPEDASDEDLILFHLPGNVVDVDQLMSGVDMLSEADLADVSETDQEPISRERLTKFARRMSKSPIEYRSWMGDLLLKVLRGEPFAEKGNRDNTIFKLAQDLGEAFPNAAAGSIADCFEQSLSYMGGGSDVIGVDAVREKIQRAQRQKISEKLRKEKQELVRDKSLREMRGGVSDFDKRLIEAFCEKTGCGSNFALFQQRLIIQYKQNYYVFTGDSYELYSEKELVVACRDLLKPAAPHMNVSIYNVNEKGLETPKSPGQLVHDYGVVAKRVELRGSAQNSCYYEDKGVFVEAPYPLRELMAEYSEEVEAWITATCGDEALEEGLRDWMAAVPDMTRPISLLCLVGDTGVGKTSFAKGVSKLWNDNGWTDMGNAFEPFNVKLKENPVLLADEYFPVDYRGKVPTDKLRSLVSSDSHMINPKNQALTPFKGFFRMVAAVNGMDKLEFGKVKSREDVAAIQKRMFIVRVRPEGAELFNYRLFVDGMAIAKHCLWLRNTRESSEERFVTAPTDRYLDLIRNEFVEDIFEWIRWFLDSRKLEDEKDLPAFVAKGDVYLNSDGVVKYWESCFKKERRDIRARHISQMLRLMQDQPEELFRIGNRSGQYSRYRRIPSVVLMEYARGNDSWDPEWLQLQLQVYTEEVFFDYIKSPVHLKPTKKEEAARIQALAALDDSSIASGDLV